VGVAAGEIDRDSFYVEPIPIFHSFNKPDSLHYCWHEAEIKELYSTSTGNLITNGKKQVPLHHVSEYDERLKIRYSCLLSQYSLNEGAYHYWHNKKVEIQESGGIYFTQPSQTIANIKNIYNDQETVLGYFWTSTVKQKRIFFDGPFDWGDFTPTLPCRLDSFNILNYYVPYVTILGEFYLANPGDLPVYVVNDTLTAHKSCFDCRIQGGTINRPDYW
jgi:hypothetical protein